MVVARCAVRVSIGNAETIGNAYPSTRGEGALMPDPLSAAKT